MPVDPNFLLAHTQFFSIGFIMGISTLHLILYLFWRDKTSNLFYSLFLLFLGTAVFFDFQQITATGTDTLFYLKFQRASLSLSLIAGQFFFFILFNKPRTGMFWLLNIFLVATGIGAVIDPIDHFIYLKITVIAVLLQIISIAFKSIRNQPRNIWIIGVGFLIFVLFGSYDLLLDAQLIEPILDQNNAYQFGVIGLTFATSIYLAQDISITNQRVLEQEKDLMRQNIKRKMLQEEVQRTQKELSEARDLQLSMLPKQLPEKQDLKLAARMRTAVEVGGDYYDFNQHGDNHITFVVGDATGHGNKAGFMVAIIKSLFKSLQPQSSFPDFFNRVTEILKQMNLGALFMALTCVKVQDHMLTASVAGMPPILVYRNKQESVEEYVLKGMPLGAAQNFPYQEVKIELNHNDVVLMASDGLHELFNGNREMFGWDRVKSIFGEIGHLHPQQILERLEHEAEGQKTIDDDITYLIMKYSDHSKTA